MVDKNKKKGTYWTVKVVEGSYMIPTMQRSDKDGTTETGNAPGIAGHHREWRGEEVGHRVQGSNYILHGTARADTCPDTFVKTHRMSNTKSDSRGKPRTLVNNNIPKLALDCDKCTTETQGVRNRAKLRSSVG